MTPRVMMVLGVLTAIPAFAQATRTWVSGVGDDVNPCSRTAPCKTFAGAISKTAAGGEINTLDSGGFGGVTITKSITINAFGVVGGVLVAGSNAIIVSAGVSDVVTLRGLDILGPAISPGLCGVRFLAGKALHVENTTISGMSQGGVCFVPTTPTGAERLFLKDVAISEVTPGTQATPIAAINITAGEAVIERTRVNNTGVGVAVSGAAKLTLVNSNISGNQFEGVAATGTATASIERTTFASNGTGVSAATGTTVRVSDSIFSFNATGITGAVTSFGNNRLSAGNTTDGTPSATIQQQ